MKRTGIYLGCVGLVVFLNVTGCVPTVVKETSQLNLTHSLPDGKVGKSEYAIAIVSPAFSTKDSGSRKISTTIFAPLLGNALESGERSVDFNVRFAEQYPPRLGTAFKNAFEEMVTKKGFNIKGPFSTFDDMTYNDKKDSYLAVIPTFDLYIDNKPTQQDTNTFTNVATVKGVIHITGEVLVSFVEPLTKEKILTRRINLSDFNIQKEYIFQRKFPTGNPIRDAAAPGQLADTTEKALIEALNEFYPRTLTKVYELISPEELLSYRSSVEDLKKIKRF